MENLHVLTCKENAFKTKRCNKLIWIVALYGGFLLHDWIILCGSYLVITKIMLLSSGLATKLLKIVHLIICVVFLNGSISLFSSIVCLWFWLVLDFIVTAVKGCRCHCHLFPLSTWTLVPVKSQGCHWNVVAHRVKSSVELYKLGHQTGESYKEEVIKKQHVFKVIFIKGCCKLFPPMRSLTKTRFICCCSSLPVIILTTPAPTVSSPLLHQTHLCLFEIVFEFTACLLIRATQVALQLRSFFLTRTSIWLPVNELVSSPT